MRVLLKVLQYNVKRRDIVVRPVGVLDGDVREHLGEGLQELCEGEVVLVGNCLHIIVSENRQQGAVVVLDPLLGIHCLRLVTMTMVAGMQRFTTCIRIR